MARALLVILLCATVLPGCAVHGVHRDQDLLRSTILDLYTNQIMDNLVRAKNGLPIIQLDYTNVNAQLTVTNTLGGTDSQATTASNLLTLPAATLGATRTLMTTLMGNASTVSANQITITAVPAIQNNEIYDAYIQYLDEDKNPNSLMVSCDPPKPGTAVRCKKFNGMYYYVPIEYQKLFFQLSLLTTAQRGKGLQAPDKFYAINLDKPTLQRDDPFLKGVGQQLYFTIKTKLPIDSGFLTLDADKSVPPHQYQVTTIGEPPAEGQLPPAETSIVRVFVPNDRINLVLDEKGEIKPPDGEKSAFYVSYKNKKIKITIFKQDGTMSKFNEDGKNLVPGETLIKPGKMLSELRQGLEQAFVDKDTITSRDKFMIMSQIESIAEFVPNSQVGPLLAGPQTAKVYLDSHAPATPTTEAALNRVNFLLQQIEFNGSR